ncbi:hypothetical protein Ahy_B04g072979 [Arachis hypogaea]|uniref:Protein FAR1-RELATED SEQUENCE n=1 Tax=Arachis hypogaea TaxID=3818 RepID=A0A444ZPD7_ARAHY|nr:hypothetical protein Ahy_B04g072979 [Arachis hypogaea]
MKKIPNKLNGFKRHEEIEQEMSHVVWNSFTKDAFDRNLNDFVTKYGLGCNKCLLGGILCRHSLSVLSFEQVDNVAPKYILERWSKNIKRRHTHIKSNQDEPLLEPKSKRFDDLVFRSHNICKGASESEELTRILHRAFDNVMDEMQEYQARSKGKSSLSYEEVTLSDVNDLQSPPHVRTRGQPKNRLGSNLEKRSQTPRKKKKNPAPSELNLLDGESTMQSSSSLYNAPDMNYTGENYRSFSFY